MFLSDPQQNLKPGVWTKQSESQRRVSVKVVCDWGLSIDCILALISIWLIALPPPTAPRDGGRGISAQGVRGGPRGAVPHRWKQRGEGGERQCVHSVKRGERFLCWADDFTVVFNSKVWPGPNCWESWMDKEGLGVLTTTAFTKVRPTVKTPICANLKQAHSQQDTMTATAVIFNKLVMVVDRTSILSIIRFYLHSSFK